MTKKKKDREDVFAREYVKDLNGTRAAIAAGYAKKSAHVASSRLLKKDKVRAAIEKLQGKRFADVDFSANKILAELCKVGFANISDYVRIDNGEAHIDFSTMTREQAAALSSIETESYTVDGGDDEETKVVTKTKFKMNDKLRALELLGKHLKLYVDRTEVSGADGKPLQIISHVPRPRRDGRAA